MGDRKDSYIERWHGKSHYLFIFTWGKSWTPWWSNVFHQLVSIILYKHEYIVNATSNSNFYFNFSSLATVSKELESLGIEKRLSLIKNLTPPTFLKVENKSYFYGLKIELQMTSRVQIFSFRLQLLVKSHNFFQIFKLWFFFEIFFT